MFALLMKKCLTFVIGNMFVSDLRQTLFLSKSRSFGKACVPLLLRLVLMTEILVSRASKQLVQLVEQMLEFELLSGKATTWMESHAQCRCWCRTLHFLAVVQQYKLTAIIDEGCLTSVWVGS